ncbi:DUF4910 domain-containing protein [Flavilitoribacter nigricans]|uniref:Glutamine cyclotransferase n=1 Tax=Flavilitoribacter nigricans (strain ATCC 23147 / DSM 23189 / NBRC 102662 / NCIMB 1420 / SS-2) TaxID=1122177 RepID=A0A2D0N538_FLAN2|nr:DUF4910 domain-containing protein [Flavilitoribacter nigricans]PHN03614.1 glutamine cyclotransferase [Flavilitoribacter nigricans DSM 23189 = NBRC 102662]
MSISKLFLGAALFCLLCFHTACKPESQKIPQEQIQVKVPVFDADAAYELVKKQLEFGPRYTNSAGHAQIRDWLLEQANTYADEVIRQDFTAQAYNGETLNGTNIIARYKPEIAERILLCAHYDTRHIADKDTVDQDQPILGADDGASGVAVLLEIARQLQTNPIPMGVDLVFFDAEDYGADTGGQTESWGLGSQYWANNLHESDYQVKYGILLDMVGARNARFTKEGNSRASAGPVVDKIWELAARMNKQQYFVDVNTGSVVDDHYFIIREAGIPMVDIINHPVENMFGFYHHTHQDNLDVIDPTSLQAAGQVVLAVVYNESNGKL